MKEKITDALIFLTMLAFLMGAAYIVGMGNYLWPVAAGSMFTSACWYDAYRARKLERIGK